MKNNQYSIKQGVYGNVVWMQGNMMPSPDFPNRGKGKPIYRIINIYEQTNLSQVKGNGPLFMSIDSKLIKTVRSNQSGFYEVKLLPGKYSIFTVEEDGKLFANSFDGEGFINVFEIKANEVVNLDIAINYKAFY